MTDRRVLYVQACTAHDAARALLQRLREMVPREEDYQTKHVWQVALAYHDGRLGAVERVRHELEELAFDLAQGSVP